MADKFIDIKIAPDGTVEVHTVGYKGTECEEEIKKLSRVLGQPVTQKKKPEYYHENTTTQQHNKQG